MTADAEQGGGRPDLLCTSAGTTYGSVRLFPLRDSFRLQLVDRDMIKEETSRSLYPSPKDLSSLKDTVETTSKIHNSFVIGFQGCA